MTKEEWSIILEVTVSVIPRKQVYMYMRHIPKGFRNTVISLYSSRIVDNKGILRTISNTGTYCLSDKVGIVYLV